MTCACERVSVAETRAFHRYAVYCILVAEGREREGEEREREGEMKKLEEVINKYQTLYLRTITTTAYNCPCIITSTIRQIVPQPRNCIGEE